MRENTSDLGVEVRGVEQRGSDEDAHYVLLVAVTTPNPQSDSRDSRVDEEEGVIVGEMPVTHADLPCADRRINAEFVTAFEEEVRAYYPFDDSWVVVLTWEAATDQWDCDRRELETYSFEPEDVRTYDEETVIWRRVNDETVLE